MKFLITDYEFDKREIVEADKDYLALKEYIHKNSSKLFLEEFLKTCEIEK